MLEVECSKGNIFPCKSDDLSFVGIYWLIQKETISTSGNCFIFANLKGTDDTLNLSIPSNTNQILVNVWYVKALGFHKVYSSSMNLFRKIRFHFMNQATVNYIK